jgi:hypothetical protein
MRDQREGQGGGDVGNHGRSNLGSWHAVRNAQPESCRLRAMLAW